MVERGRSGVWCAAWLDLGAVEVTGDLGAVVAWARAQPAAEHLLSVPGTEQDVPLDGDAARLIFEAELADRLQAEVTSQVVVERATGVLAARAGISVKEASSVLKAHAERRGAALAAVAAAVVDGSLPDHELMRH